MSRGPGKWQRFLLDALKENEHFAVVPYAWNALGRDMTRAEEVALRRAAKTLVLQGVAKAQHVMIPDVNGHMKPQLVIRRADVDALPGGLQSMRAPWPEWLYGPMPELVGAGSAT